MSVKFDGDLKTLVLDLEARGYRVRSTEMIAGSPGRTADIYLHNGTVIQWDAYSHRIWANGSTSKSQRTERFLRCLYEGGIVGRIWISTICGLRHSARFVGRQLVETIRRAWKITEFPITPRTSTDAAQTPASAPYSII